MREFFSGIARALEAGGQVELVSVVAAGGSTPRGPGAMLAVFPGGRTAGTIGGGSAEYEAAGLAAALLETGEDALRRFRFAQGEGPDTVCGGSVTALFHRLSAKDAPLLRALAEAAGKNADAWLVWRLEGETVAAMALAGRSGAPSLPDVPADLLQDRAALRDGWFAVPVAKAGRLYIFGGGHVSQALVPAAAAVGFRPVVYDDRPEFAVRALFPRAEEVLCGPFEGFPKQLTVTPDDYVAVMTRGHQSDYEVLSRTLRSGAKYLGCIGSRRKLALCRERLLAAGFTAEEYARVHAPIGLAIGAETPEEIAVSVTAELIAVRAGL